MNQNRRCKRVKKEAPNAKWTATVNGKVVELSQDLYEEIYWYARHDIIKMLEEMK